MEIDKKTMIKDASLLLIGAIISLSTSLLGDFFKDNRAEKKESIRKKLEFNYELSKALGDRFYYTYNLIQHQATNDSSIRKEELSAFYKSRLLWNQNIFSYKALLSNYYGESTKIAFEKTIYNPLVNIGHDVENKSKGYSNLYPRILKVNNNINTFIEKLYKQAE